MDTLPPGSFGPATGNAITGQGTSSGASGADSVGASPATVVAVQGAGGQTVVGAGSFQAPGQYGVLSMDAQGNFNYVRNPNTPDGVKDVFNYTLADAAGANASTTLTIDIAQVAAAAAGQGVVALPAGVELSDIHVNGRDLVINMPDGSQMVIPNGAVFVPEITIGDVQVPPTNIAALLVDSEPQPAAGPPPSSGGNWNDPVPPLDPGVPLGDLIPPTELGHTPPTFQEPAEGIDTEPTIVIETPDFPAGAVNASESVNEKGLPTRNGGEPAGSGEIADGNASNDSDGSETNTGTIVFTAEDGLESITINGEEVTAVGQEIAGEHGTLTITGIDLDNGQVTYSYTLGDNTSGDATSDLFTIVVTDDDGDAATGTLTVNIIDDVPTARDDTDSTGLVTHVATGNVMTGADTTSGLPGADTVGADNATLTAVSSNGTGASDNSFDGSGNLVVEGSFGTLVIKADGSYTYTLHSDAPGGSVDVFTYTLTDGDGDTDTATLTITNPDHQPTVGTNDLVQLDDDALPGGNSGGPGDDPDSVNTSGTVSGSGGDGPLSFALTADGAPAGFSYSLQANGDLWVMQGSTHVLTITLDGASGAYTVTQVAPIDHPAGDTENNVDFDISYTVTDSDGDSVTGHLPVNVDDDTPIARNDTDAVAKGADSTDGNVLTGAGTTSGAGGADSAGADGLPDGVTGIHAGVSGTFADVTDAGTLVHGTFGDLVIHADGTYTYTLTGNPGAGGNDVFTYEIIDGDGDVATATLTILVPADSIPVANDATALVDDDGLPAGNHDSAPGDDTQNPDPDNNESTFSGSVSANFGTDGPGTFTFGSDMDGKVVTIGQEQVTYHVVGNVLTAEVSAGARSGTDLFTVTLNSNGSYTVELLADVHQVDDGTNTENNASASITFTAHDNNGDTDDGTLTISFDDDIPVPVPPGEPRDPGDPPVPVLHGLVDEDDLAISNGDNVDGNHDNAPGDDDPIDASGDSDPTTTGGGAGSLDALFNAGADTPLTFALSDDTSGLPVLHSGGVLVTYEVVGNVLTASAGSETVFTLTVNADGSWTFDLVGALDHPAGDFENNIDLDLGSIILATDSDGDSSAAAGGAFIITVDDDLPTAIVPPPDPEHPNDPPPPLVSGLVDEDDLDEANGDNSNGNHDVADGDDNPGNLDGDNNGTTTGGNAGSLAALFNAGADLPLTIVLSTDTSGLEAQALTSNGHALLYSVDADAGVLTAYADLNGDGDINPGEAVDSNVIFTLTVNADGTWEFDLQDQLDHSIPGTEDNILIDFSSVITAEDYDGDPATAAPGSFVVNVDDDMPQPFNEENCPQVTVINDAGSHSEGQFDVPPVGADDPAKWSFGVSDGDAVLDSGGDPVTAEGIPLFYFVNDSGVLEAREGGESGDIAFTITLNQDGSFEYNQLIDIDNGATGVSFENLTSTSAGNVEFRGVGANDPATTVDLLLSAEDGGADATVNTDSDSIGSANQSMDAGETVRIDFVTNLVDDGSTPSKFGYGDHVSSDSFTGLIPQVQGNQGQTVAFTVWALDSSNTQATEPDRDPTGGFSDSSITQITSVTVTDYLTGNTTTVDVTGFTPGVFTAVDFGISVRVNADGSVTFSGIQEGDGYGFKTGTGDFNAVAVQAESAGTGGSTQDSFDLGVFSIGVADAGEPVDFSVPVVMTDADGDPVTCDIDITLSPPTVVSEDRVTVNEAGLDGIGSAGATDSEIASGDLSDNVSGTGPFTFALAPGEDGNGTFGHLVLNPDGTYTYTLDTPVDSSPDADDGTNPEIGAETFTYEVTDGNGVTTTGTITVTIIDDVPTANNDSDSVPSNDDTALGNVITGASTDGGTAGPG
ncbi:MAG TPA: VCBS domain-containing protein, partial [Candidatus Limnocylindrales bacterium]|nr:VCBS domain-containing protein [Candidatus Limnocylindrales bacterium]